MAQNDATLSQNRASEPMTSTWLSANAGSGKTKVLTDRVARLLLSGVSPQNILCLTYTKAAASEMQNRLFKLLGAWAMEEDEKLRTELAGLGETPKIDLSLARQLFARAIETPGGLKIQTIHSFCAALLRRFPLEAGVSPQFTEMDDRAQHVLLQESIEALALDEADSSFSGLAAHFTGADFLKLVKDINAKRQHFRIKASQADIWARFGLPADYNEAALLTGAFQDGDAKLLRDLAVVLAKGIATDQKNAVKLSRLGENLGANQLVQLEGVLLYASGANATKAKIGAFPSKDMRAGAAARFMPQLEALMLRVEHMRSQRTRLYSAEKTLALHNFARPFLAQYETQKLHRGWLDFDDLIEKAGALLEEPSLAAWVLYRLDGRIDHILVDEAQDTSPAQWKIITLLTQEFTSGLGARENDRTIFVVGDPKQSIYSFQGAEPAAFSQMRDLFQTRLADIGKRLENRKLEFSFRSSPAILGLADLSLKDRDGMGDVFLHSAFFKNKPGRIDLWPAIENIPFKEEREWTETHDIELPQTHTHVLGQAVADEIERLINQESLQNKDGTFRPVRPSDILILVRRRTGGGFNEIIQACKARGLPIAGADRLRIGAEIAVKDLTALLRFLATPEDDLSLAAVLRSPLFGLSEGALYDLAQPRPKGAYLWSALRKQTQTHPECVATLTQLRDNADFLRPYELLELTLNRFHGRKNLLARLGPEAEDGIDALLNQALGYESTQTPSLTGFLEWLDAMEITIKRQVDSAGDQIRVMTVHGAKGLEAPIVFLPDTASPKSPPTPELLETAQGDLVWKARKSDTPTEIQDAADTKHAFEAEELLRLLYVATTRAESWLIIAAAGNTKGTNPSWYGILEQGLQELSPVSYTFPVGVGQRYEVGEWLPPHQAGPETQAPGLSGLPDWVSSPAPAPNVAAAPVSPSSLEGDKALARGENTRSSEQAKQRGRQLHLLLETLPDHPSERWPELSVALLSQGQDQASPKDARALCQDVSRLITSPNLAHIFATDTLAEVDITAELDGPGGTRMLGIIDRLVISPGKVLIVDFKSNAAVPKNVAEIPSGILRQMGAYIAAIGKIFPDSEVQCEILWTTNGELMPIPPALAAASLSPP